jgi:hypothetical protein
MEGRNSADQVRIEVGPAEKEIKLPLMRGERLEGESKGS